MSDQSLDQLLKAIPPEALDQECSDRFLADVARMITQWQTLPPYFDISRGEERSIRESFRDYDKQKQEFLFKWKEKNPGRATNRVLLQAIYSSHVVDLAHNVCQLLRSQATTSTTPVVQAVSPLLLEYQIKLKMKYHTHKPVMATEWPPPCSFGYIQLVLVPKKPIERGEITNEDVYDKICLDIDEAMDTSEVVDIEKLLATDSSERKVILFEGAPGSGKSMLLWHITQMWQSGEQFQQFTLVLLMQLKDPAVRMAKTLADLLPPRAKAERVACEIEAIQGEGVLIMLDGWDEAPTELREEGSFFHDLIAKPCDWSVEKAAIVVSSRPMASYDLWMHLSKRVALRGFTREMRERYIKEALSDSKDAQSLIDKIESAETSDSTDFSHPLNVASLVHIFRTRGGDLPPTPCRIAIELVLSILFRHIKKTCPRGKKAIRALKSFEDLPQPVYNRFQQICKIAYDCMVNQRFTFTSDELIGEGMDRISDGDDDEVETLSLLEPECSLISVGTSTVYHFLHLSHQELCAAYHISRLPDPEKTHVDALRVMLAARNFSAFESVGKFYSALTALNIPSIAQQLKFLYNVSDMHTENAEPLYTQNSNADNESDFESQPNSRDESEMLSVSEKSDGSDEVQWENDYLYSKYDASTASLSGTVYSFPAFLEFVRESMNPKFIDDAVGEDVRMHVYRDTEATFAAVVSMSSSLKYIMLYMHYISSIMFSALRNKPNLKQFVLYVFHSISDCGQFEAMKSALRSCPNLKAVYIRAQFSENVSQLSVVTQTFQHMQLDRLNICAQSSIKDDEFAKLAPAFLGTSYVIIQCKEVGPCALGKLQEVVLQSNCLHILEMKIEQYGGEDREFFGCLRKAQSVNSIVLVNKDWTDSSLHDGEPSLIDSAVGRVLLSGDLVQLAQIFGLDSPPVVDKILHVHIFNSCLKIDFKNKSFISVGLVDCRHKRSRSIEVKNKIKVNELELLFMSLRTIAVEELNLMGHELGGNCAFVLQNGLAAAVCLKELIIRECKIGEEGIIAVFAGLAHNQTLKTLDAAYNHFGDCGAIGIARLINKTSLEVLDIGNCGIGEAGVAKLSATLRTNTTLRSLGLYSGRQVLTQCSEIELSRMLLQNRTLSVLKVNQNHIKYRCYLYSDRFCRRFELSQPSMQCLLIDLDAREIYHAIKVSPVIASIGVDRTSHLGQAISSGDMELAGEILQLNQLPHGKGEIKLNMDDGTSLTVDYSRHCVTEHK